MPHPYIFRIPLCVLIVYDTSKVSYTNNFMQCSDGSHSGGETVYVTSIKVLGMIG